MGNERVLPESLERKYEALKTDLAKYESAAVAFSAGVDSTLLLKTAADVLTPEKVLAVTAMGVMIPQRESGEAEEFCRTLGVKHVTFEADVLSIEEFRKNVPERCYYCKKAVFSKMIGIAEEKGIKDILEGSNMDDEGDFRPGHKAIKELIDKGFGQLRVRIHGGNTARIEVLPERIADVISQRDEIVRKFREYGFSYVALDLKGYRIGSMNEVLINTEL